MLLDPQRPPLQPELLLTFAGAHHGRGRCFAGLTAPHPALAAVVPARQVAPITLRAGDLLALTGVAGRTAPALTGVADRTAPALAAFGARGDDALAALGLSCTGVANAAHANLDPLFGWLAAHGARPGAPASAFNDAPASAFNDAPPGALYDAPPIAALDLDGEDALVLKARAPCTVWVINAATAADLTDGEGPGEIFARVRPAAAQARLLPPPLGHVRDEFTVTRATARAYRVHPGEIVQIIDVEGQQCSDFMAFRTPALDAGEEVMIDSTVTRTIVGGAFPRPGLTNKFYDSGMRPLLEVVHDTVGRHDTFALACTARGYEERGFPGHVNCSDNISAAMAPHGVRARPAWPAINFFFNSWIDREDNHLRSEEAWSRPGDYVAMRALSELTCVSTACPDDIDPINGWNPTDIHVRIYAPDAPVRRAIAYRPKEDAPITLSRESAFHDATAKLTQDFVAARNLWAPRSFQGIGTRAEYWACRNAVTVQDMSGLRKYDIVGPDAARLLQHCLTRNMEKLAVWRGTYALICDELGQVVDDGTLFRLGEHLFRWCCGAEEGARRLADHAKATGYHVRIKALGDAMPNLAVQGPKSRELLSRIVFTQPHVPRLADLRWFGATLGRLHDREGAPFMVTRSGYTGELGYEIFCDAGDAVVIWDAIFAAGEDLGVTPMGSAALDTIRIEAGFAAAGAEFAADVDAFEAGLGFAVDLSKEAFVGKAALQRNAAAPRRVLAGLVMAGEDVPTHGAPVLAGERQVGTVTSATYSPTLGKAVAMARLAVEYGAPGTALDVGQMGGRLKRLSAHVTTIPFIDPRRERARA